MLRWLRWTTASTSILAWLALGLELSIWHDANRAAQTGAVQQAVLDRSRTKAPDRYPAAVLAGAVAAPLGFVLCRLVERRSAR